MAARTRARLIEEGRPFIAQTVFSHPSKLQLVAAARAAGEPIYTADMPAWMPQRLRERLR